MQVGTRQVIGTVQLARLPTALQNNRAMLLLLLVVVVLTHKMQQVLVWLWQLQGLCLQWWLLQQLLQVGGGCNWAASLQLKRRTSSGIHASSSNSSRELCHNSKVPSSRSSSQGSSSSSSQVGCYNSKLPSSRSRCQASSSSQVVCYSSKLPSSRCMYQASSSSSSSLQQVLLVAELCWLRFRPGSQLQKRCRLVVLLKVLL
jgi:hypothetical protein